MESKLDSQIKKTKEIQPCHEVNTEPQNNKGIKNEEREELQAQQSQGMQGNKANESVHLPTATPASLTPPQPGNKESAQNKKHQTKERELKKLQEQHNKKYKKKLVGENQERINFLVQASRTLAATNIPDKKALASQVGSLASAVGRRCVLRLASSLKRCLCKGCGSTLVYGLNARVRHRSKRQKHLVVTCLTCHTIKRFVSDPKHKLWFEQEEAVA